MIMGAVLVLTPLVIAAWPSIAAAVMGAAASMGFSVMGGQREDAPKKTKKKVETEIENSEVVAEQLGRGEKIVIHKGDITIEFGQDERGACTVCVHGDKHSEKELKAIGEEVAGRVVQQFAYHKLMTELKSRNFNLVEENVMQDGSIQVRVRL
jgi:Protein of unknown function (DUF1257)